MIISRIRTKADYKATLDNVLRLVDKSRRALNTRAR